MSSINFSGLSSGIDSKAIIDQLVTLEEAPARLLEQRKTDLDAQLSIVGDVISKLQALGGAARDLDEASAVRAYSAVSGDETRVTATSAEPTAPGTYRLRVGNLATAETTGSATFGSPDAGVVGVGAVDITVGAAAPVTVNYDGSDSLYDIAVRITDEVDGVSAQVLHDGSTYRILVNGDSTGLDNALGFTDSGSSLGFANIGAELVGAADAEFELNGVTITRAENTFSDVIDGVTFELKAEHDPADPDTVVQVDYDIDGVREKVQAFVDAYNGVAKLIDEQLSYNGEQRGRDTLFGDSTLTGLRASLSSIVTNAYNHGTGSTSLGLLGVELSETGTLSIDSAKFDSAVAGDREAIEHLFAGDGGDAVAALIDTLTDSYTRAGDGILVAKQSGMNTRIDGYSDQIERIESRAASLGERMLRQFTDLEVVMAELQTQAGYLSALFV